jgi:hypothetical protein|tara:strand:- start:10304 stop:11188 length:885 start_codon:yes stop_codon:yes gene_type:complete
MAFPTTGSNTELQAVNQILASVGQAPVTTLTTDETFILSKVSNFSGTISGSNLTTTKSDIPVGSYISGPNVTLGTSVAVAGVEVSPATNPVTYNYVINISQNVSNQTLVLSTVETRVQQQANPDVAISLDTLREVSREVQSEGWSFNKEYKYPITPDSNNEVIIANNILQIDLNRTYTQNKDRDSINREGKLYDKISHSFVWTDETLYVDVIWYFDWESIPVPIQAYIVARAASIVSSRIIGDPNQYQMLLQKEALARSTALEYECRQGDYTYFGTPEGGDFYQPYQPFHTLQR